LRWERHLQPVPRRLLPLRWQHHRPHRQDRVFALDWTDAAVAAWDDARLAKNAASRDKAHARKVAAANATWAENVAQWLSWPTPPTPVRQPLRRRRGRQGSAACP
jgi:hypothetical protein